MIYRTMTSDAHLQLAEVIGQCGRRTRSALFAGLVTGRVDLPAAIVVSFYRGDSMRRLAILKAGFSVGNRLKHIVFHYCWSSRPVLGISIARLPGGGGGVVIRTG